MNCRLYKLYDWFKTTPVARVLYFGQQFRHFGPIEVEGIVVTCIHDCTDGDEAFDVKVNAGDNEGRWHCELTPCSPESLRLTVMEIVEGDRVHVKGIKTWDPPHLWFKGGGNEIHPIENIEIIR